MFLYSENSNALVRSLLNRPPRPSACVFLVPNAHFFVFDQLLNLTIRQEFPACQRTASTCTLPPSKASRMNSSCGIEGSMVWSCRMFLMLHSVTCGLICSFSGVANQSSHGGHLVTHSGAAELSPALIAKSGSMNLDMPTTGCVASLCGRVSVVLILWALAVWDPFHRTAAFRDDCLLLAVL